VGKIGELLSGSTSRVYRRVTPRSPRQFCQRRLTQHVGHSLAALEDELADGTAAPGVAGIWVYRTIAARQMAVDEPDDFKGRDAVGRTRKSEASVHAAQRFQEPRSHKRLKDLGKVFFRQSHLIPDPRKWYERLGWLARKIRHAVDCIDARS
jgi:hypothetical protein